MSNGSDDIRRAIDGAARPPRPVAGDPGSGGRPPGSDGPDALDWWCSAQWTNDIGNARRLARRFGEDLAYLPENGWLGWDGQRWSREKGSFIAQQKAHATVEAIYGEAKFLEEQCRDHDRAKAHYRWAIESGASARVSAMLREAQPELLLGADAFDARPDLVTAKNGTIELGPRCDLRAFRREDRLTRAVQADFTDDADCPVFRRFLETVLPDSADRDFLQRWFGYALTGHTREQVCVMLLGEGSNGKSTLIKILSTVIGDLHASINIRSLMFDRSSSGSSPTPDIARLPGARMVTSSEPEIAMTLSEARIKDLTGDDLLTARHLNHGIFEFRPQLKLTMVFNNLPTLRGQDVGTRRRFLLVRFTERVGPDQVGPVLEAFPSERDGILRWLLDGAEQWYEAGLRPPAAVTEATGDFWDAQGGLRQFLAECCIAGDAAQDRSVSAHDIYEAWKIWCRVQGEDPRSQNLLGKRLREAGFKTYKSGIVYYLGVALNDEWACRIYQAEQGEQQP